MSGEGWDVEVVWHRIYDSLGHVEDVEKRRRYADMFSRDVTTAMGAGTSRDRLWNAKVLDEWNRGDR